MRAIIIDDKDAKSLVEKLELTRLKESHNSISNMGDDADRLHRIFHYVVVQWLQEQGANLH